ncbi:ATP-dependent DNA helicase [Corynebacterium yudongzhengii]|uniref:DNA 3'-5' helicase n=1 Tax=Corynebacterium yudongzhengii TaxID=2080740 RepID=A0A2U1T500_9CORY|nr:ATP-dependent DNA helicase [Corynebacterium yudongzhengii]AWB81425.1 ATP-dependent DNA helicase [Corynebacterium yudongzhengii]PWC01077.1 ATP-dependent helicase [Corynebacterium yudongzhengii]
MEEKFNPVIPPHPQVRLVRPSVEPPVARDWPVAVPTSGRWRVTGSAGSGVSSFVVDTVVEKILSGADPTGILVVTASKEAGARLREKLHRALLARDESYVSSAPLVRSVHSLAFALLREKHEEQIRLITGAEQDGVIRELLAGHAEDGRGGWPAEVIPALTFVGFARQLRDFLLRAVERGLRPEDLIAHGRAHDRPLWEAAGRFLEEYEQTMALSGTHNYSASELVSTVLNYELEQYWHTVIVDDAQHLDPKSGELIRKIMPGEPDGLVVVGGDPQQSVFHFRGASPEFFDSCVPDDPARDINLGASRREPARFVAVTDSVSANNNVVADYVRRAHLEDGIAWSDIAVIVRSTGDIGSVRRALLAAGVPVHINPTDVVLAEQHLVAALLLGLRALDEELSRSELEKLLLGPVGGADPVTLRRLLRGLRRYDPASRGIDTLAGYLAPNAELPEFGNVLTQRELDILHRLRRVLEAGRDAVAQGGSVEEVLWALWSATDLSNRLLATALRGGPTGSQADRDLDAVMALFDAAGDFVERHPGTGSVETFVEHITAQELPTGVRDRRTVTPEAVSVLTAHGAVGSEYRVVAVAGVQEGSWPSLGETGSLFDQEDFLDLVDRGIDPVTPVSHTAARLAEERRLFHVATTRATDKLLVTAVDNVEAAEPVEASRFLDEFREAHETTPVAAVAGPAGVAEPEAGLRILSRTSLIAELRRTVSDPARREDERRQAARQLARLARAGVPGAHPDSWASVREVSTDEELRGSRNLSPSRIEALTNCPLRAVVGRIEDEEDTPLSMSKGTLAHAYLEAIGRGVDEEYARLRTVDAFGAILNEPEWKTSSAKDSFRELLEHTHTWLQSTRDRFRQLGVEVDVDVGVIDDLRIRGRIDRLEEENDAGAVHIVDLKTSKSALTTEKVRENLQLFAYQLALSRGRLDGERITDAGEETPLEVGGATLVYPAASKTRTTIRQQVAKTEEELQEFAAGLPALAEHMRGPRLLAQTNDTCRTCPITHICPVQPEGEPLTYG